MSTLPAANVVNQAPPLLTGEQLRHVREAAGLRQADLARALDLPRSSIWAMEHGRRPVPSVHYDRILAICAEAQAEQARLVARREALLCLPAPHRAASYARA